MPAILDAIGTWLVTDFITILGNLAMLALVVGLALRFFSYRQLEELFEWVRRRVIGPETPAEIALGVVARQPTPSGEFVEGTGLWISGPIHPPADYAEGIARAKVLAVGNLKGGVGKTTVTGNLAAFLAETLEKPVLAIDLDFQGSLSSLAVRGAGWLPVPGRDSLASRMISGDLSPGFTASGPVRAAAHGGETLETLEIVPAYYELAQAENRITVEWLLSDRTLPGNDVRYTLARLLNSPEVAERYGAILLDCPPRLTVAHIQALAAATHLLIPTIFDKMSSEAVVAYALEVENLRRKICPHLSYLGVVGSVWNGDRNQTERSMLYEVEDRLRRPAIEGGVGGRLEVLPVETFLRDLVWFKSENIAYATQPRTQQTEKAWAPVEALGLHVIEKMGLT